MGHAKHTRHPHLTAMVDVAAVLVLPLVEWFDDLTSSERVAAITRGFIWTALAIVVVAALSACEPGTGPVGPQVPTPATTGPAPTTTAPTTTTGRCEEDQPSCWDCSPADNACGKRL